LGKVKKKIHQVAYSEALNEAFQSVYDLKYKYSGVRKKRNSLSCTNASSLILAIVAEAKVNVEIKDANLLYALTLLDFS
jgi:hypothetical protein